MYDRVFLIKLFLNFYVSLVIEKLIFSSIVILICIKGLFSSDDKYFKFIVKENLFNFFLYVIFKFI